EGLVVFLGGLPGELQQTILAEQMALAADASLSERLGILARRSPVLHKLGQVLARDPRLAEELRSHFRPLESLPPTVDVETIRTKLVDELGPLENRRITLAAAPIAEASVAVVIPFHAAGIRGPYEGVFKLLKPGIESRLDQELELLARVGDHLDCECESLHIPQLDYRVTFEQVREKLRCEIQLDQEQRNLAEAAEFYADEPDVQIPTLLVHSTPRVTAMERVFGEKVTDHRLDGEDAKRRLAKLVVSAVLAKPFFSSAPQAMFHSDPHAGNLLHAQDGRLALLDWSLVGHLGEAERIAMGQIVLAAVTLDGPRIESVLAGLVERGQVNRAALRCVVDESLRRLRRGELPGLTWLVDLLDAATQAARLRVGADMMLFRKTLHMLEGVIGELGAKGVRIEDVLLAEFVRHFGREWPDRWFAFPTSRAFSTRLSNADLAGTLLSWPLAAARFWQAEWLDCLRSRHGIGT
ncbi:MAG: AarF/UbiB family protein, partial [Pirellulales bacterium]